MELEQVDYKVVASERFRGALKPLMAVFYSWMHAFIDVSEVNYAYFRKHRHQYNSSDIGHYCGNIDLSCE